MLFLNPKVCNRLAFLSSCAPSFYLFWRFGLKLFELAMWNANATFARVPGIECLRIDTSHWALSGAALPSLDAFLKVVGRR